MIIARVPFRVSFFGGGSDIPGFFLEEGGQVLSAAIDKYCYVTVRELPPFFDHSIRLAYSRLETCQSIDEIQHPLIRTALKEFGRDRVEIHYDADLPGGSGLGTSSAFGVGLAVSLAAMEGKVESRRTIAERVIHWERELLKEAGGYQDQIAAAYGGLNHIRFSRDGTFSVHPFPVDRDLRRQMLDRMVLCHTKSSPRLSSDVSVANDLHDPSTISNLRDIRDAVDEAVSLLSCGDLDGFGKLLHETWLRKRSLRGVTNSEIDNIYDRALAAGALGGKILGAGGGGFLLLWCGANNRARVVESLGSFTPVPFGFDNEGARLIYLGDS